MKHQRLPFLFLPLAFFFLSFQTECLTLHMMAGRRSSRKGGGIKKELRELQNGSSKGKDVNIKSLNKGKGQEITGVTLPKEGEIKGWQFGDGATLACTNIFGSYYALSGSCPRCAFDLYRGKNLVNDPAWDEPSVACPTCSTTYSWRDGRVGATMKQKGIAGFVGDLAQSATVANSGKDATSFAITVDYEGKVYCRQRDGGD
eukprot:CAMPEP_0113296974 /NCGR_PEP_ID=MMETSP0010_2-20120614/32_1 /TAXON_ID=216773 ORGANISM="Corethron hystrix, Strain 308" /NCGR_SAMPLE_ID=MMETSP0010_2 /ASSEMBLY_ACC=CAM_ASM_000155 /LENGTH=201 /DNA_ID=CAMNT_0000149791 /DNA_START=69 /DNA_END=674 /DNA_ORIENTATION=+ /assembly_acc=CAM_ASM_000155